MIFWMFVSVFALALACIVLGRNRALGVVNGEFSKLHSLPTYHGGWLALVCAGPGFMLVVLWTLIVPRIERIIIFDRFSDRIGGLGPAQLEGMWRDVRAMVEGGVPGIQDALRAEAAQSYASLHAGSTAMLAVLLAIVLAVGFAYGWRKIAPPFRARHRVEGAVKVFLVACAIFAVLITIGIVFSLIAESLRFFTYVSPIDFLFGLSWTPQQMAFRADQVGGEAAFGFLPLLAGTLLITAIAIAVAAPIGLLSAIYLSDYASKSVRAVGKPVLEVLAGIPTVVYGFFAALTVAPAIRDAGTQLTLDVSSESALAAGVVMGIMIVPFVSSLSDDVINAVPQTLRDGSLAMGATKSETIRKVVLPAALPGIVSSLILAVSRAIGETMIVIMAAGLAANLTLNPLEAVTTVTVQIGTLLTGDQEFDSPKTLAAFALGLALFLITLVLNMIALRVVNRYREQYE
ncbi:phosphate ABC transporter permease subunit PstC [Blastochloris viridis]|uniref:Phosphate transport system permease protein n=1 Tax=Blastochloris viridis TaxID=1079 RepID=A0A0H5BA21_BLAVI|nr:phosphate ABC transporter permease subunit PstC [Blastochloris viridis]ALK10983.1 Phosphate transport system permease protein PstC [Blastochloris viridis]BAR99030.1 phosphate transport system permease protein PstC [Blastochloris viridis]CUU43645.1 Phosphate transport system permease protein pstC [Blastochloris viridis]